jgi:hypothetical protein
VHHRGLAVAAVVALVGASCLSCTDGSGSADQSARQVAVQAQPVDLVDWWTAHPSDAPVAVDGATVVLDRRLVGSVVLSLPAVTGYQRLLVALTCSQPVEYVVQLGTQSDPAWSWTKGESCDGPNVNTYTTAELNPKEPPLRLYVMVPAGTRSDIVMYGIPPVHSTK